MNHIYEDAEGMRVEVHETPAGRNIMFDNIHLGFPQKHAFAGVLVPDADRKKFITDLAAALGVKFAAVAWDFEPSRTAVEVHDYHEDFDPGDWDGKRYAVSGDIDEILTAQEQVELFEKWEMLGLNNGSWSSNYFVQDLIQVDKITAEEFDFESEGMCFFAYTDSKYRAQDLAKWINEKGFLK